MKKYFLLLLSTLFILPSVFALPTTCVIIKDDPRPIADIIKTCGAGTIGVDPSTYYTNDKDGVRLYVKTVATVAISLGALLAVGALVWSGIQYTKSYAEDEKIKKAKTTAIYALIGLTLLMGSFGFIDIFLNFIYTVANG